MIPARPRVHARRRTHEERVAANCGTARVSTNPAITGPLAPPGSPDNPVPDLPGVLLGAILFGLCAQCARYSVRFIAFMICVVAGPTSASMLLSERSAYVAAVTPTRSVGSEGGSSRL